MVRMLNVSILRGATAVGASRDSLEMDTIVQVDIMNKVHVCKLCIERGCIRCFLYLQISMSVQPKACVQLAHSVIILLGATYVNVNQVLPRMVTLVKVCKNTCLIFCVCMYKPSKKKAYSVYG